MGKKVFCLLFALFADAALGAERAFDFSQFPLQSSPTGFVSQVSGAGKSGDWKIIEDEVPLALAPLSPNAPKAGRRFVLAQLAQETTDEHFPLLIFNGETFGDFTLTTRFKCVSGSVDQMAGIAFRLQDEKNFYVVRASSLGNSFRFYKVVNGERSPPIGPQIKIPAGVWHEMSVAGQGNQIRCSLNGQELFPVLTDNSFAAGKIAFWTKSDSVSYFADTKIIYTPRVSLAQKIITEMIERYPRVIGLKIFAKNDANELRVIASNHQNEVGEPGGKVEATVLAKEAPYYAKGGETVSVITPLKDRNGDANGVLRIIMKPFPGQTERNVLARATPIVKAVEARMVSAKDLTQ